jgi:hypothetical protein
MIYSIPTKYKGFEFRSRLEARWAIYFDKIGLKWDYEPEGYVLEDGTHYLPDFHIPYWGYIEIKPIGGVTEEAIKKCKMLSKKMPCAIFEGAPDSRAYMSFIDGEEGCAIYFNHYTVRKWQQIPYFSGWGHLQEIKEDFDLEDFEAIIYAKSYKYEFKKR